MKPVERDVSVHSALPLLHKAVKACLKTKTLLSPQEDVRKALKTHLEALWRKYPILLLLSHGWKQQPFPERIPSRQSLARPLGARTKKKKHQVPWVEIARASGNELNRFVEPSCLPLGMKRLMNPFVALWDEEVVPLALHIVRGELNCLEGDRRPFRWVGQEDDGLAFNVW